MRELGLQLTVAAVAWLAAGCASSMTSDDDPAVEAARAADDAALDSAGERLGFLEQHWVAVAGGEFLGGAMLPEDVLGLLPAGEDAPLHAYFFRAGEQGDAEWSAPALFSDRMAGDGLWPALGLGVVRNPVDRSLVLEAGTRRIPVDVVDGTPVMVLRLRAAAGHADPVVRRVLVIEGFDGTLLLDRRDGRALGSAASEIPGQRRVQGILTGKSIPCRRCTARVDWLSGEGEDAEVLASGLVEVAIPGPPPVRRR